MFGTMLSRCLVGSVFLLLAVHSATIKNKRNIPVSIIYDHASYGSRNLHEKVQISNEELLKMKISDDLINEDKAGVGIKNLDEKIQLSPEELGQVMKYSASENEHLVKASIPQEPSSGNTFTLLNKVEEIIYAGIYNIRNNIDKVTEGGARPSQEAWENLNKTLQEYLHDQYKKISLKDEATSEPNPSPGQNNENQNQNNQVIQNWVTGFQQIANNFMQTYFPQNNQQGANGAEDEQQPQGGPFQNLVNLFQGGINQVVNNMNNLGNQNPSGTNNQEDTGSGQNPPNFFNNVVNSVQQFFQGGNQGNPTQVDNSNNQADTGTQPSPPNPQGIFQGAVNQFSQVFNNFRPTSPPEKPVQGDEGTQTTTQRVGIFQSIGNQIGNAISQGNFFGQNGGNSKPPNSEDEGTPSSTPSNNFIQNIGQAFQNVNIFRPQQSTQKPSEGGQSGSSNPISAGAEAVNNQLQQFVGNQGAANPVESIQNAISGAVGGTTDKTRIESSSIKEILETSTATVEKETTEKQIEEVKKEEEAMNVSE